MQKSKLKAKNLILKLSVFVLFILFPGNIFSAEFVVDSETDLVPINHILTTSIYFDSEQEQFNAVSGEFVYNPDILEIDKIIESDTAINFWLEKPESKKPGSIIFSGITPGGISGKRLLFKVLFKPKLEKGGELEIKNFEALRNDGEGTKIKSGSVSLDYTIIEKSNLDGQDGNIEDKVPPEQFYPLLSKDPDIFDGKSFLVFDTKDKQTGISHFEVREGLFGKYEIAQSPYLIKSRFSILPIYIKAVDMAGNERIESFYRASTVFVYKQYMMLSIIILVMISLVLYKRYGKKRE